MELTVTSVSRFNDNRLTGTIPPNLSPALQVLVVQNNKFNGTVPELLCSLGLYDNEAMWATGIQFDCNEALCGCCWCPCAGSPAPPNHTECRTEYFIPAEDDGEWPGAFPSPPNSSTLLTLNIRTDGWPQETNIEWSKKTALGLWETVHETFLFEWDRDRLKNDTQSLESDTEYRMRFSDHDGICCSLGFGWLTITNSVPSSDFNNGTVLWHAAGDIFQEAPWGILDVFFLVDNAGSSNFARVLFPNSSDLVMEDHNWPGMFPTNTSVIAFNVQTDSWSHETSWEWSTMVAPETWEPIATGTPGDEVGLHSYIRRVEPNTFYKLKIFDSSGDGTCCRGGFGWFTITNSTPSDEFSNGTVIWDSTGAFFSALDVRLWVDADGSAQVYAFEPSRDDADWPGAFPSPIGVSNAVSINIRTDNYPTETALEWSVKVKDGSWRVLEHGNPSKVASLVSSTKQLESDSLYKFRVSDSVGDGTCCQYGKGWFTITNSTPSNNHARGTVIWEVAGDSFGAKLSAYIQTDSFGNAFFVTSCLGQPE